MTEPATLPAATHRPLLCGGCGYDLRSADGRCPECGRRFDPGHTIEALIPWERRPHLRYIDRVQAYLWTVGLMTFRAGRVARFLDHPVSFKAARQRAAALGQYACAPLNIAVLVFVPITLCWWIRPAVPSGTLADSFAFEFTDALFQRVPFIAGGIVLLWLGSTLYLLRLATRCRWRRLVATAIALPPIWAACLIGTPILAMLLAALAVLMAVSPA